MDSDRLYIDQSQPKPQLHPEMDSDRNLNGRGRPGPDQTDPDRTRAAGPADAGPGLATPGHHDPSVSVGRGPAGACRGHTGSSSPPGQWGP